MTADGAGESLLGIHPDRAFDYRCRDVAARGVGVLHRPINSIYVRLGWLDHFWLRHALYDRALCLQVQAILRLIGRKIMLRVPIGTPGGHFVSEDTAGCCRMPRPRGGHLRGSCLIDGWKLRSESEARFRLQ